MFTLRQTLSATLAAATLFSSGAALADPCDTYLTTELNWVRDAPAGYSRGLGVTIVSLNANDKASYTDAFLNLQCQNGVMYGFGNGTTPGLYTIP